jgi:hypothetical protein
MPAVDWPTASDTTSETRSVARLTAALAGSAPPPVICTNLDGNREAGGGRDRPATVSLHFSHDETSTTPRSSCEFWQFSGYGAFTRRNMRHLNASTVL